MIARGFRPAANRESRVLILGTLAGPESLRQRQCADGAVILFSFARAAPVRIVCQMGEVMFRAGHYRQARP